MNGRDADCGSTGTRPALSVLDLAPIGTGSTAADALRRSEELAVRAERLGYHRYWLAEHHGMPSIASSAPEILIGHIAGRTRAIRVGSGGIMMQNHVPLRLAESFHTLETLHPGRIDLGIGRAPGTDPTTSRALRPFPPDQFTQQLAELRGLSAGDLPHDHPLRAVRVIPAGVDLPPIWILGSSGASARLAGSLGLGYSFARHFSPAPAGPAIREYVDSFAPSERFREPHAILAVSVICAPTDEEADYLAATGDLVRVRLRRGEFFELPSPEEALAHPYTAQDRAVIEQHRRMQIIGGPDSVRAGLEQALADSGGAAELMIASNIHGHAQRMRSYEIVAEAWA